MPTSLSALRMSTKRKRLESSSLPRRSEYPEPGSNRHALRHWCLRPARLPIPPSGHFSQTRCKSTIFILTDNVLSKKFYLCPCF